MAGRPKPQILQKKFCAYTFFEMCNHKTLFINAFLIIEFINFATFKLEKCLGTNHEKIQKKDYRFFINFYIVNIILRLINKRSCILELMTTRRA